MSKPSEPPILQPRRTTRPPKTEVTESDGWKASAQTQRLLHELRVHQIELEMQNEELRASRAEVEVGLKRYTDLYDFAPVGYLTLSPEGSLRELNLPAARLLGRERSRLVGGRLRTFVSTGTRVTFDSWLANVFAQQNKQVCEVVLMRDNLPPLCAQLEAKLSFDGQSGRAVITDITSRKALEDDLRQAQKLEVIGQLAGGVAHDFNNLFAAMLLNLGLLRTAAQSPLDAAAALQNLDDLAKRASSLTSQLLLFSQRQVMQPERLELNAVLTRLLALLEVPLGEAVTCSFRADTPELWVEADVAMLEQVVMNLCINARDAMPNGGALSLQTSLADFDATSMRSDPKSRPGQFVCLKITDSGGGMDAEVLKHLFEPFFTTKDVGKGNGLGLASVYGMVQQHHGWLNVESLPGRGTTFRVYLPRSSEPAVQTPSPTAEDLSGNGETLLLVEDEPALLAVATRALIRLGYRVLPAIDGRQALAIWEEHAADIDLILADMRMPNGLSGLVLAERLQNAKPSLKVLIMSGYSAELAANGAAGKVEFAFLAKPFELESLAKSVRRALNEAQRAITS